MYIACTYLISSHWSSAHKVVYTNDLFIFLLTAKRTGMSPNMLKRVGLWESQKTLTPGANSHVPTPLASSTPSTVENQRPANSSNSDVKRYSFQSKTISPDTGMPPRAMSFDHQSSGRLLQGLLPKYVCVLGVLGWA